MRYTWTVQPFTQGDKWGADWRTAETNDEGQPYYAGHVDPTFTEMSDACGHAAMWVARLEASFDQGPITVPTEAQLTLTEDHLAEALDAYQAQFGDQSAGGVTLGG